MNINSKYRIPIFLLLLLGSIVYLPGFFNGFAWDDLSYILTNKDIHQFNLLNLLGPNLFNSGMFYRPIPTVYFALLYSLFEQQAFFYHFAQISLHIINTVLLFILFLRFFPRWLAFFLSLIFLVHPINVESVAFISQTTNPIYFLFGISAFLLGTHPNPKGKRIFVVFLLLLLAFLTKETGFLFLLLVLLYRYIYNLDKIAVFVLSGVLTGIIYLLLRNFVGGVTFATSYLLVPISELPFLERLVNIPAIILYYLKTFIFPLKLSIWQVWITSATFQDFFFPLVLCLIIVGSFFWYIRNLYKQEKIHKMQKDSRLRGLLFFTCWYLLGMAIILQIIPLNMTVAERWFYFPIVGTLGVIGVILLPFLHSIQKYKTIYIAIAVIIVSLFSIRTFVRIFDWKDNTTIIKNDAHNNPDNPMLLDQLALVLYNEKNIEEAIVYANKSVSISPNILNLMHLGLFYKEAKQYDKAIASFTRAIQITKSTSNNEQTVGIQRFDDKKDEYLMRTYIVLTQTYILANRTSDAISIIEDGLKIYPDSSQLYFNLAYAEYKLGNTENALSAIKKSYVLSPNQNNEYIYYRLKNGLPLNIK